MILFLALHTLKAFTVCWRTLKYEKPLAQADRYFYLGSVEGWGKEVIILLSCD